MRTKLQKKIAYLAMSAQSLDPAQVDLLNAMAMEMLPADDNDDGEARVKWELPTKLGAMGAAEAREHATGRNAGGGAQALALRRPLPRLRTTLDRGTGGGAVRGAVHAGRVLAAAVVHAAMRGRNEAGKTSEDEEFEYTRRKKFGQEYSFWTFRFSLWEMIIYGAVILALVVALGIAYFS